MLPKYSRDVHYEKSGNGKKPLLRQPVTQKRSRKSQGSTWQFYKLREMGSCSLDDHGYTRAFGDGPRNFEPWSSDVDDT
ncbi:hypothetical protein TNCV_1559141 [Trichonephila clavipes]|nr:hypothetical protein TNCV_1559141 [Trichonephila clavipes]